MRRLTPMTMVALLMVLCKLSYAQDNGLSPAHQGQTYYVIRPTSDSLSNISIISTDDTVTSILPLRPTTQGGLGNAELYFVTSDMLNE